MSPFYQHFHQHKSIILTHPVDIIEIFQSVDNVQWGRYLVDSWVIFDKVAGLADRNDWDMLVADSTRAPRSIAIDPPPPKKVFMGKFYQ